MHVEPRSGPVVITIEYRIPAGSVVPFLAAMSERRRIRKLFDQYEMGLPAIAGHASLLSPDATGHAENWRRLTGAVDLCVDWAGAAGPAALDTTLGSGPDSWDNIDFVLERLGTLVDYCAARKWIPQR